LREAAGPSETVAVEVTVFDAGAEGHAPAVSIQANDLLTYLGRFRIRNTLGGSLERSKVRIWLLEIHDEDGDLVYSHATYAPDGNPSAFGARRDVEACFYAVSLDPGPPCPIDVSE
jgi:hypothetical protein